MEETLMPPLIAMVKGCPKPIRGIRKVIMIASRGLEAVNLKDWR